MSAETTPADVGLKPLAWKTDGSAVVLGLEYLVSLHRDPADSYEEVWLAQLLSPRYRIGGKHATKEEARAACHDDACRRVSTVLATRPAEPAAPVAEAGNGEVERRWIGQRAGQPAKATRLERVAEIWRDQGLIVTEWVPRSTLEAERARADAAEQRAADALARAEKAERALETAQEERKAASEAMRHVGAHFPECAAEFDAIMDRKADRASREAQPATDGGDNG